MSPAASRAAHSLVTKAPDKTSGGRTLVPPLPHLAV